jgi:hypothetical protein
MKERQTELPAARYQVDFFRTVYNDVGASARCNIDTIKIRRARGHDRALEAALRRFERRHRVSAWHHVAHGYECCPAPSNGPAGD